MRIEVEGLGKRFNRYWVFRNFSYHFETGQKYAIIGGNGSGKTTLLTTLTTSSLPTEGKVNYFSLPNERLEVEHVFKHISWVGPYTEIINEFTVAELFNFYEPFRKMESDRKGFLELLGLQGIAKKPISKFSSGMQQKVKLALAFTTFGNAIFLDEPTSFLDKGNTNWFNNMLQQFCDKKIVIISSNQPSEYELCQHHINMADLKNK